MQETHARIHTLRVTKLNTYTLCDKLTFWQNPKHKEDMGGEGGGGGEEKGTEKKKIYRNGEENGTEKKELYIYMWRERENERKPTENIVSEIYFLFRK